MCGYMYGLWIMWITFLVAALSLCLSCFYVESCERGKLWDTCAEVVHKPV